MGKSPASRIPPFAWTSSGFPGARRASAPTLLFGLLLLAAAFCSALHAVAKPFWYDEICTVIVCRLPGASAIWKALDAGLDGNPPGFYIAARAARQLVGDDHMGYRLISIVGLLGGLSCVYFFLSRRVSRAAALVGAAFLLCTPVAEYAYEARPYALMFGCVSLAALAWQRLDDSRLYPLVLVIALATAESIHYLAILAWPAFGAAEAAVWLTRRRFRIEAWAAFVLGASPLLICWQLLKNMRQYSGQHFWARPSGKQILFAHDWAFNVYPFWGLSFALGFSVLILLFALPRFGRGLFDQPMAQVRVLPVEEQVLTLMLLWLPVFAVTAALVGHGGMTYRYMMPTVLGAALALGQLSQRLPRFARAFLLGVIVANFGLDSAGVVKRLLNGSLTEERAAVSQQAEALVSQHRRYNLPIVISSALEYLPMAYYARPDVGRNLYALVDPPAAVTFNGSDTADLAFIVQRRYFPMQAEDYASFASRHRDFLLLSQGGMDYWPARFLHDGENMRLVSVAGSSRVYKVSLKP